MLGRINTVAYMIDTEAHLFGMVYTGICHYFKRMKQTPVVTSKWVTIIVLATPNANIIFNDWGRP